MAQYVDCLEVLGFSNSVDTGGTRGRLAVLPTWRHHRQHRHALTTPAVHSERSAAGQVGNGCGDLGREALLEEVFSGNSRNVVEPGCETRLKATGSITHGRRKVSTATIGRRYAVQADDWFCVRRPLIKDEAPYSLRRELPSSGPVSGQQLVYGHCITPRRSDRCRVAGCGDDQPQPTETRDGVTLHLVLSLVGVPDAAGEVGVPFGVVLVGDGWADDTGAGGASAPDSLPQPARTSPQAVTITIVRITTSSQDTLGPSDATAEPTLQRPASPIRKRMPGAARRHPRTQSHPGLLVEMGGTHQAEGET